MKKMIKTAFFHRLTTLMISAVIIVAQFALTASVVSAENGTTPQDINLLSGKQVNLCDVPLSTPYVQDPYNTGFAIDYSSLKYNTLTILSDSIPSRFRAVSERDEWNLGDDNANLALLASENNTEKIKIAHTSGASLDSRAAILYDIGGIYDLSSLTLGVDNSVYQIRNFSVYAGDAADATLFDNRIATGGSTVKTDTSLPAVLKNANAVRYVLIVFDHVTNTTGVNKYGYTPFLTKIECFGTNSINALLNNTSGRVLQVDASVENGIEYVPDYDTLTYTNLKDSTDQYKRFGTDFSGVDFLNDPSLVNLTDGDTDETVSIMYGAGSDKAVFVASHRMVVVYDLGALYDLTDFIMKVDLTKSRVIRNFSVYAGDKNDSSILSKRVGTGGGTGDTLSASLSGADCVRFLAIVFDHVTTNASTATNYYAYDPALTQIECYGNALENVLKNNQSGTLCNISLSEPYVQDPYGTGFSIDYSTLKYDNLTLLSDAIPSRFRAKTFINNEWTTGNDADNVKLLTTDGNTQGVLIDHSSGGAVPLSNRSALLYDLGGMHDLVNVTLGIDNSSFQIRNFSVYAGNAADATLFDNRVATGGSTVKTDTSLSVMLNGAKTVRYLLIVFDHVTNTTGVNQYAYRPTLTKIDCYGKNSNNILLNNTSGRVLQVDASVENGIEYVPDYDTLTYTNLSDSNEQYKRFGTDFSGTDFLNDPSLVNLTDGDANESVEFKYGASSNNAEFISSHRIAVLYDLGALYNLSDFVIKVDLTKNRVIRNFSVYAGDKNDSSILSRRVGTGGGTGDTLSASLSGADAVRYLAIVFDHITTNASTVTNYYAYDPALTQIECYGAKAGEPVEAVFGDITGDRKVDIIDLIRLKKNIAYGNADITVADLDVSGVVDTFDLVILRKMLMGVDIKDDLLASTPNLNPDKADQVDEF